MISLTKHNELKGYKSLEAYPEVAHFVTTRHEGISTGAYGSFNCSPYTNDSCMNVNRNQSWLFQCMNHQIKELFIPEQSHGCASLIINTHQHNFFSFLGHAVDQFPQFPE